MSKKIGLVLSGGGMRGLAHFGVLKALYESGIFPEIITGASMGSIVTALFVSNMDYPEMLELIYSINPSILDIDYKWIFKSISKMQIPSGFLGGKKIEKLIDKISNNANIKDINYKKFGIVASNLNGGQNIVFTNSEILTPRTNTIYINNVKLSKAVRSSISLPMIFTPVILNDMLLVDGGVVNNCPTTLAQDLGAEFVFISDITYHGEKVANSYNGSEVLSTVIDVLLHEADLDEDNDLIIPRADIKLDSVKNIPTINFSKENFDKAIQAGYDTTKQVLSKINIIDLIN